MLFTKIVALLAIASASAIPLELEERADIQDVCRSGFYGQAVPVLLQHPPAQIFCARTNPPQCTVASKKAKRQLNDIVRRTVITSTVKAGVTSQASTTKISDNTKESMLSSVLQQGRDILSTVCSCIQSHKECSTTSSAAPSIRTSTSTTKATASPSTSTTVLTISATKSSVTTISSTSVVSTTTTFSTVSKQLSTTSTSSASNTQMSSATTSSTASISSSTTLSKASTYLSTISISSTSTANSNTVVVTSNSPVSTSTTTSTTFVTPTTSSSSTTSTQTIGATTLVPSSTTIATTTSSITSMISSSTTSTGTYTTTSSTPAPECSSGIRTSSSGRCYNIKCGVGTNGGAGSSRNKKLGSAEGCARYCVSIDAPLACTFSYTTCLVLSDTPSEEFDGGDTVKFGYIEAVSCPTSSTTVIESTTVITSSTSGQTTTTQSDSTSTTQSTMTVASTIMSQLSSTKMTQISMTTAEPSTTLESTTTTDESTTTTTTTDAEAPTCTAAENPFKIQAQTQEDTPRTFFLGIATKDLQIGYQLFLGSESAATTFIAPGRDSGPSNGVSGAVYVGGRGGIFRRDNGKLIVTGSTLATRNKDVVVLAVIADDCTITGISGDAPQNFKYLPSTLELSSTPDGVTAPYVGLTLKAVAAT